MYLRHLNCDVTRARARTHTHTTAITQLRGLIRGAHAVRAVAVRTPLMCPNAVHCMPRHLTVTRADAWSAHGAVKRMLKRLECVLMLCNHDFAGSRARSWSTSRAAAASCGRRAAGTPSSMTATSASATGPSLSPWLLSTTHAHAHMHRSPARRRVFDGHLRFSGGDFPLSMALLHARARTHTHTRS